MLVVFLCCMMKLVEVSLGKPMGTNAEVRPKGRYRRRYLRRKAKGMSEVGLKGGTLSPDSDCNSNHFGSASYLSTSSQDIDFIQDNSDYQWFLDYGYRDGGINHHTSILSLPEAYEVNDLNYYDTLAKNMDANLAEADMESFKTEDIHALLTNLPPICTNHASQENNRQGECYASVSGSIMGKFEFDSPHTSSQEDDSTSMSICKSELLFSPVKEMAPLPGVNFSVDSLDCDFQDMMLTCQANKNNYTIAFEGSVTMYSEDSEHYATDNSGSSAANSAHWPHCLKKDLKLSEASMTRSDLGNFTTWSKLKKRNGDNGRNRPSGNNNNSGDDANHLGLTDNVLKSRSMPELNKQKIKRIVHHIAQNQSNSSSDTCTVKRKPVKVFDIQHQAQNSTTSVSEMATSVDASSSENIANKPNFSLVKLFMKQKSMSAEGMSTTMDQLSSAENWPQSEESTSDNNKPKMLEISNESSNKTCDLIAEEPEEEETIEPKHNLNNNNSFYTEHKPKFARTDSINRSIQTSNFSEINNLKNKAAFAPPVKVVEPSFLKKLKQEGEIQKPVYVLYPNYVLPDLGFLNDKPDAAKVLLMPQKAPSSVPNKKRPFSCNDLEILKRKGFSHVKDWDSLNFLLPQECRQILGEIPELSEHIKKGPREKPTFVKRRPLSCDYATVSSSSSTATQPSSGYRGSSTILNDSQGSPAPVTNLNPLFVYRYDSVTSSEASLMTSERQRSITTAAPMRNVEVAPPRPPLPRGILSRGNSAKRYSVYATSEEDLQEVVQKRKSCNEPYYLARNKRLSETEDEGVDAGTSSSSLDEQEPPRPSLPTEECLLSHFSSDELTQFEEFLKQSGISGSDSDDLDEASLTQLRSYVSRFLALKINQEGGVHFGGKKSVSFAEKVKHLEVKQLIKPPNNSPNASLMQNRSEKTHPTPIHTKQTNSLVQKWSLINSVTAAVEQVLQQFAGATTQAELMLIGDSNTNPAIAKLLLNTLCPALYAILSDSLKPNLETSFGSITNSVWQVVEASAKQGPLTKALNELVMRINSEDCITEGLVKFNTFVFGLLNVRSLDAWMSYLRTRETVLRKHYGADSLFVVSHTGGADVRTLLDNLIVALQQLAKLPFQLDLFFEYRELHNSFKRMDSYQQVLSPTHKYSLSPNFKQWSSGRLGRSGQSNRSNSDSEEISTATVHHYPFLHEDPTLPDLLNSSATPKTQCKSERPRSCVDSCVLSKPNFKLGEDVTNVAKKRWSGISLSSKLYQAYDRLSKEEEEEYTDSLEHNSPKHKKQDAEPPEAPDPTTEDKPLNGKRFRKLQQKWEMLSGRESPPETTPESPTHASKSRIPRPITSPIRPTSGIPVKTKAPKKVVTSPGEATKLGTVKNSPARKIPPTRTSRVDQMEVANEIRHPPRPSSLPYKPSGCTSGKTSKLTPPRRAASSSLNRKSIPTKTKTPKLVRTLSHRLPSDNGHLSYNEGEILKVVLKVDDKWLLCCRGTQKGLVPSSAVISADNGHF